jgi:hypothetical protein
MFGKLSLFINYLKVFEVYTVKRFPTNKLPLAGLITAYFSMMMFIRTYSREFVVKDLYRCDKGKKGNWKF